MALVVDGVPLDPLGPLETLFIGGFLLWGLLIVLSDTFDKRDGAGSERPTVHERDERGRLHSESGPALAYADGYRAWAWHGVRVDREVIEEPVPLDSIVAERNAEVRRVRLARYGAERYLHDVGAKVVHRDDWGTLWRAEVPGDEPLLMVEVINPTVEPDGSSRAFFIRVPPTMRRARQAVAWTFDIPEQHYRLEAET